MGGGEMTLTQIPEFWENENMTVDSAKIQQVHDLLLRIVFLKSIIGGETLQFKIFESHVDFWRILIAEEARADSDCPNVCVRGVDEWKTKNQSLRAWKSSKKSLWSHCFILHSFENSHNFDLGNANIFSYEGHDEGRKLGQNGSK